MLLCCSVSSQIRNSSVSAHFYSDSSPVTSNAATKYEAVPEPSGRNEEQDNINVAKRWAKRPDVHFCMKSWFPCNISFILMILLVFFFLWENFGCFVFQFLFCWRENKQFDFRTIGLILFPWKDGKKQPMKEDMDGKVFLPARNGIWCF